MTPDPSHHSTLISVIRHGCSWILASGIPQNRRSTQAVAITLQLTTESPTYAQTGSFVTTHRCHTRVGPYIIARPRHLPFAGGEAVVARMWDCIILNSEAVSRTHAGFFLTCCTVTSPGHRHRTSMANKGLITGIILPVYPTTVRTFLQNAAMIFYGALSS